MPHLELWTRGREPQRCSAGAMTLGQDDCLVIDTGDGADTLLPVPPARAEGGSVLISSDAQGRIRIVVAPDEPLPLLLWQQEKRLLLARSVPAMLTASGSRLAVDPYGLAHMLSFGAPPRRHTMWNGITRIEPGAAAEIMPGGRLRRTIAPKARLRQTRPPEPAGKRVGILADRSDATAQLIGEQMLAAGARSVLYASDAGALPADSLARANEATVRQSFEPYGTDAFQQLQLLATQMAPQADLLLHLSADPEAPARHAAFGREAEQLVQAARSGELSGGSLLRDRYFDRICLFSEAERLALSGPGLLVTNVVNMADELGTALDEPCAGALEEACRELDEDMFERGCIAPGLAHLSRVLGTPIQSVDIPPSHRSGSGEGARLPIEPLACAAAAEVLLSAECRLTGEGYLMPLPLSRLVQETRASPDRRRTARLLAILSLELWLRATEAARS